MVSEGGGEGGEGKGGVEVKHTDQITKKKDNLNQISNGSEMTC